MSTPRYVAIITDGNGRWAKERGLSVQEGHRAGADTVKARLRDAAEFYTLGRGHALPDAERDRMTIHWHIWEPQLTDDELDRLVDFLATLTDESFKPQIPPHVPSGLLPIGTLPEALAPRLGKN